MVFFVSSLFAVLLFHLHVSFRSSFTLLLLTCLPLSLISLMLTPPALNISCFGFSICFKRFVGQRLLCYFILKALCLAIFPASSYERVPGCFSWMLQGCAASCYALCMQYVEYQVLFAAFLLYLIEADKQTNEIYAQMSLQLVHFVSLTTNNYIQGKCSITVIIIFHFFHFRKEMFSISRTLDKAERRLQRAFLIALLHGPQVLFAAFLLCLIEANKQMNKIYAHMSLRPVHFERDVFPIPDFGLKPSKHPTAFFCKTLTASDTSTHGGFSVPWRAAEKLFRQSDYTMQPLTQELVIRDLHNNTWTFRHIYRGQRKSHFLTTGWSMFVRAKRLRAGDDTCCCGAGIELPKNPPRVQVGETD